MRADFWLLPIQHCASLVTSCKRGLRFNGSSMKQKQKGLLSAYLSDLTGRFTKRASMSRPLLSGCEHILLSQSRSGMNDIRQPKLNACWLDRMKNGGAAGAAIGSMAGQSTATVSMPWLRPSSCRNTWTTCAARQRIDNL